jgi:hypothetical protein
MHSLTPVKDLSMPNGPAIIPGQTRSQSSQEKAVNLLADNLDCCEPAYPMTDRQTEAAGNIWVASEGPIEELYAAARLWVIALPLALLAIAFALLQLLR